MSDNYEEHDNRPDHTQEARRHDPIGRKESAPLKISTLLDQIDLGTLTLPEFQRGYVWRREQVREFLDSLYRRYPVGSLLVWETRRSAAPVRPGSPASSEIVTLLLDGQQRLTTLYGIARGRPPAFFQGDPSAFTGLHFHVENETFEFYAPLKMRDDPLWIDLTTLMQQGLQPFIERFYRDPALADRLPTYLERLNKLRSILDIELHVDKIVGEDKTLETVVEIFNRVNSGGTTLSLADLALAKLCASWPEARQALRASLARWERAGFRFRLEWLLRTLNAVLTGQRTFDRLVAMPPAEVRAGLQRTEKAIDYLINLISSRLGLDHDRVLGSPYSLTVLARFLHLRDLRPYDAREIDRLLYWYVYSVLRGRYAGTTESAVAQDIAVLDGSPQDIDRLIEQLRRIYGKLEIRPADFQSWSIGARFYPLLYLLARVARARDWLTGVELSHALLGKASQLQLHHIFPKSLLYEAGYRKEEVNALGNFAYLTQSSNLTIGAREPAEYLPEIERKFPGALASQWVPLDPDLWRIERYRDFLAARNELLAAAANRFLDGLLHGTVPHEEVAIPALARPQPVAPGSIASDEEERALLACSDWLRAHGLPEGLLRYELVDDDTGALLAVLDLAWPNGIQEGRSEPVALLLDEPEETIAIASRMGYRCFTTVEDLQEYVRREILVGEPLAAD